MHDVTLSQPTHCAATYGRLWLKGASLWSLAFQAGRANGRITHGLLAFLEQSISQSRFEQVRGRLAVLYGSSRMHALRARSVFDDGIYWPRVLDLSWALTANLAIWILLLQLPSVIA